MNRTFLRSPGCKDSSAFFTLLLAFAIAFAMAIPAHAQLPLVKLSTDKFQNSDSEHKTEVEPDTFAWGSTIVSAFQVARVPNGGGADVGFATSTDGGKTWTSGYLPGLTDNYKGGSFTAASDAAVAYDAKHGQWLISTLPITNNNGEAVATSRSADGIHWGKPVIVDHSGSDDKNWITCDNTATSAHYGNCYSEWDEPGLGDVIFMSTSTDGGATWGPAKNTADQASGLGGQPVVQPNGTVVVPIDGFGGMIAFSSTDGGKSWSSTSLIANQNFRGEDGGLRSPGLPSAAIDGAGTIYVVWPDCSFRTGCSTDDIVLSTSTNGKTWTKPFRIPIDSIKSTVDHFIPGLRCRYRHLRKNGPYRRDLLLLSSSELQQLVPTECRFYGLAGWRRDLDSREKAGWTDEVELAAPITERVDGCRLPGSRLLDWKPVWGVRGGQGSQWRRV